MNIKVIIMAKHLIDNYDQTTMVVINFSDHLHPGTFEHALHYLIENKVDTAAFDIGYNNDQTGRLAYNPKMLLKIILFAYSKGITSSREIAWNCTRNITFMVLACQRTPHWTTIAHFVSANPEAIKSVFEQVLLVCEEQGLIGHDLIAIDGCKLPGNASKQWSGTFGELAAKRDKIRRRIDWALSEQHRLDELGESDRAARQTQTIESLAAAAEHIEQFLKENEPRIGTGRDGKEVKSNITDNDSAKMKTSKGVIQGYNGVAAVDQKHQVVVNAEAFGQGQEQSTLSVVLEGIQATFDAIAIDHNLVRDGVIVTADTGFASEDNMRYLHEGGFDAYIPDNQFRSRDPKYADRLKAPSRQRKSKHGKKIPASEFDFDPLAKRCRCPAGKHMILRGEREDGNGHHKLFFEARLTDCRHCPLKERCMRNPDSADNREGHGRQVSFICKKRVSHTDWMRRRVDSDRGKEIYGHRMSVVEPVFGNLEHNKGLKRFSLRGKAKVNGQWQLFCLVQNIEKLQRYGQFLP